MIGCKDTSDAPDSDQESIIPPSNLKATAINPFNIKLTWQNNCQYNLNVEISIDNNNYHLGQTIRDDSTNYVFKNLQPKRKYYFRIHVIGPSDVIYIGKAPYFPYSNVVTATTPAYDSSWQYSSIAEMIGKDADYYYDIYNALSIDRNDNLHVVYAGKDGSPMYGTNTSGQWQFTTVETGVSPINHTSIALDSRNKVHLCYYDNNYNIKYATNVSGQWQITKIGTAGEYNGETSIAIGTDDKVHIVYHAWGLQYATNKSGQWIKTTIAGSDGAYPSVVVDSYDSVHVCMSSQYSLYYAKYSNSKWITSYIASLEYGTGSNAAMTVDANGSAHISYINDIGWLWYATNKNGQWQTNVVGTTGFQTSITIDMQNNLHICCVESYGLTYYNNVRGSWQINAFLDQENPRSPSIKCDHTNRVNILYQGGRWNEVKCVSKAP